MTMTSTQYKYYHWLMDIVGHAKAEAYSYLIRVLHDTPYTYISHSDSNRYYDGIDLRYRYGQYHEMSDPEVAASLDISPCSMLEMMVALALRLEEQFLTDPERGDRTALWFWNMIASLGLSGMTNSNFNRAYIDKTIYSLLHRGYRPNGLGSLFMVPNNGSIVERFDIWEQAMIWCNYCSNQ